MIREKENTEIQISNSHEPTETVQAQNTFGFSEIENLSKQENIKYVNRIFLLFLFHNNI